MQFKRVDVAARFAFRALSNLGEHRFRRVGIVAQRDGANLPVGRSIPSPDRLGLLADALGTGRPLGNLSALGVHVANHGGAIEARHVQTLRSAPPSRLGSEHYFRTADSRRKVADSGLQVTLQNATDLHWVPRFAASSFVALRVEFGRDDS